MLWTRSRLFKLLQVALGLAIVVFTVIAVQRHWDDVQRARLQWTLRLLPLAGGIAMVWAVFALLSDAWRRMVAGFGFRLDWWAAARIWLLSSMAKYVPGKVWSFASIALMSNHRGVPAWVGTGSAVLLQILATGTGALVVAITGGAVLDLVGLGRAGLTVLGIGSLIVVVLSMWPRIAAGVIARFSRDSDPDRIPSIGTLGFAAGANLLSWVGYGIALWLFAAGSIPGIELGLSESIAAFTAAYVAGLIVPLAPSGLGVREAVLVLALQGSLGTAGALALAAVGRLGHTAAEIGAVIPFLFRKGGYADVR